MAKTVLVEESADHKVLQEQLLRAIELFCERKGIYFEEGKVFLPKNYTIDSTYICMWSVNDFENIISKLIAKTNTGQLPYDEFFRYLQRIYLDQSVVIDKNITLEPLEIGAKRDRITFEAVRDMWLNMIGVPQKAITHAMIGDGIGLAGYGQTALFNELSRVKINQANNGSLGIRGETLFINASFSSGLASFTAKEAGTANDSNPTDDRMQFYIQFDSPDQKGHISGNDIPQFSTSASICTL